MFILHDDELMVGDVVFVMHTCTGRRKLDLILLDDLCHELIKLSQKLPDFFPLQLKGNIF